MPDPAFKQVVAPLDLPMSWLQFALLIIFAVLDLPRAAMGKIPAQGIMTRSLHQTGIFIALFAVLLQGLVPLGWMPASNVSGEPVIVICTGHGPLQAMLDVGNAKPLPKQQAPGGHKDHDRVCPFAAAAHFGSPPVLAAPSLPIALPQPVEPAVATYIAAMATRHSPQSSRGPPSLA